MNRPSGCIGIGRARLPHTRRERKITNGRCLLIIGLEPDDNTMNFLVCWPSWNAAAAAAAAAVAVIGLSSRTMMTLETQHGQLELHFDAKPRGAVECLPGRRRAA